MHGFEPVTFGWKDETFTVPADRQLRLIAEIEDALVRPGEQAIAVLCRSGGPTYTRLAAAYGAALRYAGADVSDDEIYLSIVGGLGNRDASTAVDVQGYLMALLAVVAPPIHRQITGADDAPGKPKPTDGESSEPSTT